MDVKFSNNGHSTLASSLTTSATSITVASGHGARFPSLSGSEYFYATLIDSSNNLEIVKVTARSTDVFTAARAQESTSARAFAAGDRVELRITAQGLTDATSTVADNAVTLAKMAAGTDGNIISYDASGDPVAVATGSAGQVLTSAGAGAPPTFADAAGGGFPSGTKMLFNQTAAPTGWTKDTTNNNDSALRVVTGTAGTGGSVAFSTAMATPAVAGSVGLTGDLAAGNLAVSMSGNISDTTLSTAQIPSHTHNAATRFGNSGGAANSTFHAGKNNVASTGTATTVAAGGGAAHNHAHNLSGSMSGVPGVGNLAGSLSSSTATINVKYVDVIVAEKD